MIRRPPRSTLFPYTRSSDLPSAFLTVSPELLAKSDWQRHEVTATLRGSYTAYGQTPELDRPSEVAVTSRSEEHTSELQSLAYLVCRLLLEKKKLLTQSTGFR